MANGQTIFTDWGEASLAYDALQEFVNNRDLSLINEAQTRFDVIDRMFREVLCWQYGNITVEEHSHGIKHGYVDYTLRLGDFTVIAEAKKFGAAFPNPTKKLRLKLNGSVLGTGEIKSAIDQAVEYARVKKANITLVTNGMCWCFFSMSEMSLDDYATLLFPFSDPSHAEKLFNLLSYYSVDNGSCLEITNGISRTENRLLSIIKDSDNRVDRNNIADYITSALNNALYADALINNEEALDKCFITTEARTKFDSLLGMHLSDPKPTTISPAKRIKSGKKNDHLENIIKTSKPGYAPPVTLIIGPVGAGKSTYLRHFEKLSGRKILLDVNAHWVYIDFEEMGKEGSPREFLYSKLRDYLLENHPGNPTDYENLIKPAYQSEIEGLARGPLALLKNDKVEFDRQVSQHINSEFAQVEPFVDKLFRYISTTAVCIIVMDNVDLYEDDLLETTVFSEGLAISKRIYCNVIVSLRDKTFVRHRTDSSFDAYELRKLWLDPPPFRAVLSIRLTYSKTILKNIPAQVALSNGMTLKVDDLSVFFDIVQKSTLKGEAGRFIEFISDQNIRHGLTLITNLLTSGHIQADRAISNYIKGNTDYYFPFHEIFKGTMLAQWKHYKEDRSECVNLFDSRLGVHNLQLFRIHILNYLMFNAKNKDTLEVPVEECISSFSRISASEKNVLETLIFLQKHALLRSDTAEEVSLKSKVTATRSGGFYAKNLSHKFPYIEACMLDTAIDNEEVWNELSEITIKIESEFKITSRMKLRYDRMDIFTKYLEGIEQEIFNTFPEFSKICVFPELRNDVMAEVDNAVRRSARNYGDTTLQLLS